MSKSKDMSKFVVDTAGSEATRRSKPTQIIRANAQALKFKTGEYVSPFQYTRASGKGTFGGDISDLGLGDFDTTLSAQENAARAGTESAQMYYGALTGAHSKSQRGSQHQYDDGDDDVDGDDDDDHGHSLNSKDDDEYEDEAEAEVESSDIAAQYDQITPSRHDIRTLAPAVVPSSRGQRKQGDRIALRHSGTFQSARGTRGASASKIKKRNQEESDPKPNTTQLRQTSSSFPKVEDTDSDYFKEKLQQQDQNRLDLDYDREALKNMSYANLHNQSFNEDPSLKNDDQTVAFKDGLDLARKLDLMKSRNDEDQETFVKSLNIEEWDEAGDWFLEKFAEIIGKMKEARKSKHKITTKYEEEVFQRYQVVDTRKQKMTEIMGKIRQQGRDTLEIASNNPNFA